MLKLKQFYTLNIHELNECDLPHQYHSQNYYELVYMYKGSGIHLLNKTSIPYKSGDLFVVSHEDTHHFEPKTKTKIIAIKFTDSYFKSKYQKTIYDDLGFSPESIMNNKSLKETKLKFDMEVKTILKHTIDNILLYSKKADAATSPIVFYQILSIFGMIKETMSKMFLNINENLPAKEKMTAYIHQHIYEPEKIKVKLIASHFNISPTYFSSYFKRKFDISFRDYINEYRIKLIEQRLAAGRMSIKEIANEFGFNDESHFSHFYKNKRGFTATNYIQSKNDIKH